VHPDGNAGSGACGGNQQQSGQDGIALVPMAFEYACIMDWGLKRLIVSEYYAWSVWRILRVLLESLWHVSHIPMQYYIPKMRDM
jgi:hypothetical protein